MEPNLRVGMIEAAADHNIGQHEMLRISAAQESDRQLLADGAVRPVAAEKPIGLDVLDPVAGAQAGRDAAIALRHRDQFGIALDPDAVSSEVLFENPFGLVLRYAENKRVAGVERTDPGMRDAPALAVYADTIDAVTGAEEIFGEAHQLEGLDRPRMDRDRSRLHRPVRRLVDHPTGNPVARQLMRHHQSGRPSPDDQHLWLAVHGMLLFSAAQEQKAVRPRGFPCSTKTGEQLTCVSLLQAPQGRLEAASCRCWYQPAIPWWV